MAESSKHPSKTRLIEFLNEDLDQGQDRTVGSHIEQCEACQSTIEEIISSTFVAVLPSDASASDQDKAIRQPGKRSFDDLPQFAENSRFLVLDELARGGMGIVYRGFDRVLKREVAIKVSKGDGREAGSIRFHREAEISGQLQHPGIIPVYEVGQLQDERYYIAMKLVEGQTLLASIGSDREKFTKHLNIFDSVCRTMAYAHSKNVIHRDLKPDNVMVGSFGEVQVMDWGLGRKLNSHSQTDESSLGHDVLQDDLLPGSTRVGDVIGTPAYIAPEQARGDQADKRADVFAMGGILYQILTGKPPFDAPTAAAAMQQSRSHDFNSAMKRLDQSGADDSLVGLVKSCLAADPSDRPVDAEHVSQTFSQYLKRRKQQDENDRLDKARIAERQIAEQQRNLQLRLSLAVVVTMLLSTVAAGYMYMSEKSARIENQANVDRDATKRVIENEEQIRSSIVNAKKYQSQAIAKAPHEQSDGWTLALKEIERSAPFATDAIDGALRTEFNQYEEVVRTETAAALRRSADHAVEGKCCERLFELSEHSYFPLDLRLCDWKDLTLQFASAFERVGIKTNEISRETVTRIAASNFKPELIHGLMMWRHELDFQASYGVNSPSDLDKIKQTKLWLSWLIEQVDPDPFRSQVRRLAVDADARSVLSLSEQEEAIASLLTIHTFALAFHSADVAAEDRVDYLLRSHQRYPKDFFVNWYLPNSGVDIRSQRGFVVACYSLRPNNPAVLSSLAQGFIRNNQPLRAAESLETLVRTAPRYLLGHRSLVEAYEMAGETAKADKQWEIAEQAFADVQLSFSNRIAHYQKSNQLDHAAALKTLLTENAQRPDVSPSDKGAGQEPLSENVVAEQQKLEIEIKKAYESVLAEPKSGPRYGRLERAYRNLCTLLKNTDRPDLLNKVLDEAISQFNDAAEKAQDVSTPHVLLYKLCEKFERRETAISSLEQAIKLNPKRDAYYWWLVNLHDELIERYRHDLQPQLAERTIDQGVKLLEALALAAPSDVAAAHESMARFCDKYRRFGSSIRAWKRAMKVSPDHVRYWKKLAEANFRLGKVRHFEGRADEAQTALDLAIQGYRQWVSNGTQSSTPHEILSEACEYRGLLAESITQLKIAIQIHPKYQPHLHRFAYLCTTHASQLKENDDTDAGVAFLLEAMDFLKQIEPEHAGLIEVYEKLSELHASNGDYDKAIEAIGVVIKSRPNDEFTLEKLDRYRTAAEQFDGKQQSHSSNPSQ